MVTVNTTDRSLRIVVPQESVMTDILVPIMENTRNRKSIEARDVRTTATARMDPETVDVKKGHVVNYAISDDKLMLHREAQSRRCSVSKQVSL